MPNKKEVKIKVAYEKDTKNYHKYIIGDRGEQFAGTFLISKELSVPKEVTLVLGTLGDKS